MVRSVLFVAALLVGACEAPPRPDPLGPRAVRSLDRWQVEWRGDVLGQVVLLEIEDPDEPVRLHRAENVAGQWLGFVDARRRVWQRVPFEETEVFRGMYTLEQGLAVLYEVDGPVELVPVEAGEAPVAFPPREDR